MNILLKRVLHLEANISNEWKVAAPCFPQKWEKGCEHYYALLYYHNRRKIILVLTKSPIYSSCSYIRCCWCKVKGCAAVTEFFVEEVWPAKQKQESSNSEMLNYQHKHQSSNISVWLKQYKESAHSKILNLQHKLKFIFICIVWSTKVRILKFLKMTWWSYTLCFRWTEWI